MQYDVDYFESYLNKPKIKTIQTIIKLINTPYIAKQINSSLSTNNTYFLIVGLYFVALNDICLLNRVRQCFFKV